MTDQEKTDLEKQVLWERERAHQDFAALSVKVELIAASLKAIASELQQHPELVTSTPPLGAPNLTEELKALDRQAVLDTCRELAQAKEKLRLAEKHRQQLRFGTPQTRIDI